MGCVSSAFLEEDGGRRSRIISHHHHIVSLTSSTYGILASPRAYSSSAGTATSAPQSHQPSPPPPPPPPPPTSSTTRSRSGQQQPQPEFHDPPPEVINSWELMAGLLDPSTPSKPAAATTTPGKPPLPHYSSGARRRIPLRPIDGNTNTAPSPAAVGCARAADSAAVLYITSLRGVRATFEACAAVRAALQAHGVAFRERDVSMDRGFRDDLRAALLPPAGKAMVPQLFVRGRHVGGAEEVLRMEDEGALAAVLRGLPRAAPGAACCDGCGGMRFLPCFDCSGSRKVAVEGRSKRMVMVVRCRECNENGLVLCPICS